MNDNIIPQIYTSQHEVKSFVLCIVIRFRDPKMLFNFWLVYFRICQTSTTIARRRQIWNLQWNVIYFYKPYFYFSYFSIKKLGITSDSPQLKQFDNNSQYNDIQPYDNLPPQTTVTAPLVSVLRRDSKRTVAVVVPLLSVQDKICPRCQL